VLQSKLHIFVALPRGDKQLQSNRSETSW